jgi:hypothetical protein
MSDEPDAIDIPYMLLADGATAVGGKLYVLGGGWNMIGVAEFPGRPPTPFSIAIGVSVPWTHTNRKFTLTIELVDADGERVDDEMGVALESGRPPGMRPGTSQNIPLTLTAHPEFPAPGAHTLAAKIDGEIKKTVSFEVVPLQMIPASSQE